MESYFVIQAFAKADQLEILKLFKLDIVPLRDGSYYGIRYFDYYDSPKEYLYSILEDNFNIMYPENETDAEDIFSMFADLIFSKEKLTIKGVTAEIIESDDYIIDFCDVLQHNIHIYNYKPI